MTKSVASSFTHIEVKKSSSFQLKLKSVLKAITVAAIKGVDRKLIEVARVYRLKYWQQVQQIILPAASPGILTGLRNSLSLAWMFMIAAELIAATQGIGYLLSDGRETSRPDIVILAIILLAVLGKFSDSIMKAIETWLLRWRDVFGT